MVKVKAKRHIAKSVTWRIVGTIDTICIGWIISGELSIGLSVGGSELFTKTLLYYLHERVWYRIKGLEGKSNLRHLLKTITWRFVGTIDTVILSWIITGKAEYGFYIGGLELFSKMILYYFHERIWYKSKFGIVEVN